MNADQYNQYFDQLRKQREQVFIDSVTDLSNNNEHKQNDIRQYQIKKELEAITQQQYEQQQKDQAEELRKQQENRVLAIKKEEEEALILIKQQQEEEQRMKDQQASNILKQQQEEEQRMKDQQASNILKQQQEEHKSRGLGDTIEKIATATGIKKVVDTVAKAVGTDCGCNKRKQVLNDIFPYNQK